MSIQSILRLAIPGSDTLRPLFAEERSLLRNRAAARKKKKDEPSTS